MTHSNRGRLTVYPLDSFERVRRGEYGTEMYWTDPRLWTTIPGYHAHVGFIDDGFERGALTKVSGRGHFAMLYCGPGGALCARNVNQSKVAAALAALSNGD